MWYRASIVGFLALVLMLGSGFVVNPGWVGHGGVTAPSAPHVQVPDAAAAGAVQKAQDMDEMEAAKVKAFPAKTAGTGNQLLGYRLLPDGTKEFELTARIVQWEVTPGDRHEAWTYNGMVPGPVIRVTEGDKVRVVLHNQLRESTAIHFHGMRLPNDQDGVPFLTETPVKPGHTSVYAFAAKPAGTHMYHSHYDALRQVTSGMLGALIVNPKNQAGQPKVNQDVLMVLGDGPLGFTINGKGFPATAPVVAKLGETVRIRYMNAGQMIHPFHLHGLVQKVIAKDGYMLDHPYLADTVLVGPGERYDVLVQADTLGAWAFHCHILSHAEGDDGMFGMVTAFIVKK